VFAKILYPTDFSDVSKKALEYVKKLKEAGTREVIVTHVIELRDVVRFPLDISWAPKPASETETELQKQLEKAVKKELEVVEAELKEDGLKVKVIIGKGSPLQEILRVKDEEDVSAIVIGSHGKSNIKEMLLGLVSENAIRHSKSPVLVMKR